MNLSSNNDRQVGRRVDRLESRAKVTGTADYTHNVALKRMLHAKIVRSTQAHANIVSIDTSAAAALPGVHMVITAKDVLRIIPDPHYGPAFHDQPILAIEKYATLENLWRWYLPRTCMSLKRPWTLSSWSTKRCPQCLMR